MRGPRLDLLGFGCANRSRDIFLGFRKTVYGAEDPSGPTGVCSKTLIKPYVLRLLFSIRQTLLFDRSCVIFNKTFTEHWRFTSSLVNPMP